jgi:hypothetical protein
MFTYERVNSFPFRSCAGTWARLEKNMTKELMDEFRKEMAPGK